MSDTNYIVKYGKKFPAHYNPLAIELWCWRWYEKFQNPELERWEHLRNALFYVDPSSRHTWNPWLERIFRAYAEYTYSAGLGCANSGKTHGFHTCAFLDYMSDPLHTQVICTTTSVQGLKTRMWPILTTLYRKIRPAGWVVRTAPHMMICADKDDTKHSIRATPIAQKADESEITDNLIGAHTDRVILLVDEATSAPAALFPAWQNLAGGTSHRRMIMLGNPDDQLDTLGRFCRPDDGWDSIDDSVVNWTFTYSGEKGIGLHFDGRKSPNLEYPTDKQGKSKWHFLFGHFDLERHTAHRERDPLTYYRMAVGWFADASIVPKVMVMEEIDAAKARGRTTFYGATKNFAALDPAFGGDRPMFKAFKMGVDAESQMQVMEQFYEEPIPIRPKSIIGQEIGERVMKLCKEKEIKTIGIDITTNQSTVADYLKLNAPWLEIVEVDFSGSPSDEPVSPTDKTSCRDKYINMVTQLWFSMKKVLRQIKGLDEETCIEMCSRYFERKGKPEKLIVESKKEMKRRANGKSPDKADSLAIGVAVFRKLGGFELPGARGTSDAWKKLAKKRGKIYHSEALYT